MNPKFLPGAGLLAAIAIAIATVTLTRAEPADKKVATAPVPGDTVEAANADVNTPAAGARQMLGSFVGAFGTNKITVCLQNLVGETLNGYSVVAGNERAFSGSLVPNDGAFELHAREPGNHPEDGRFVFVYHPDTSRLSGSWTPNNPKLAAKTFDLPRRTYRYDPSLGVYPQSSTRVLKVAEVENQMPVSLRLMRNEIYARHGYSFRMRDMRDYFDVQDWYMPVSNDVTGKLTAIELKNEKLIKRYENYGKEFYDGYGR